MQDSTNYKQAYLTQSNELTRLTAETSRLTKELHLKEEQYAQLLNDKARSDGGSAGLREAFDALREDMNKLQGEFDVVNKDADESRRQIKELQGEKAILEASLENEKNSILSLEAQLQTEHNRINPNSSSSSSSLKTPAKKTPSKTLVPSTPTTRFGMSPTSKEVGRLHAEILQERRRLSALQEEHADLLGLLAQQEVELKVFRDALESEAGVDAIEAANEQAQRIAIDLYGTYVSFRGNDVLEDEDEDDADYHRALSQGTENADWRD
jgi:uncharacterized coiled-coil DUF342 family protein